MGFYPDFIGFNCDFMGFYGDFMRFYSDFMGLYCDVMGLYSESMQCWWDYPLLCQNSYGKGVEWEFPGLKWMLIDVSSFLFFMKETWETKVYPLVMST